VAELVAEEGVVGALLSLDDEEEEDESVPAEEGEVAESFDEPVDSPDFVPSPFVDFLA
jgi:hypothetical protein